MPSEFVIVTPVQLLAAYGIWLAMVFAALGIGWWLAGADRLESTTDDPDSVVTVEIPVESRTRRRGRPPRTGAIHAAHLPVPDESPTQVIRLPNGGQS
ncbi:hypothetical protein O7626_39690 [Micromonospora sp. WMMD1102]|uniref:hypothetical protein n=1 Tax=Micromonospora sp. WMMD1102 TaxID=3016105 RepID=UPI0024158BD3|nr:hypothetical protein [Micromonospora sp. WMMD1102]MDG4791938.1 hypothetical protein [Micromonospora sp. WMMD1102]